jgi:hypothetical protein
MKRIALALAALGCTALAAPAEAQTRSRVEAGVLECNVEGSVGLILGSQRQMACRFNSADRRYSETYYGRVTRVGLDVGVTGRAKMLWAVFAPTRQIRRGALAGNYAGVSAEASAGVGAGANALVGGSNRTIALQPLSIQAQTGVNLALGISGLELFAPVN